MMKKNGIRNSCLLFVCFTRTDYSIKKSFCFDIQKNWYFRFFSSCLKFQIHIEHWTKKQTKIDRCWFLSKYEESKNKKRNENIFSVDVINFQQKNYVCLEEISPFFCWYSFLVVVDSAMWKNFNQNKKREFFVQKLFSFLLIW